MLKNFFIILLTISLYTSKFCSTLSELELNLKKDLKGRKLESILEEGKIIQKNSSFILYSFLLNGKETFGMASKHTNEKIESIENLSNFSFDEKIENSITGLIGCVNDKDELFVIFNNYGENFYEENIKEYFLENLSFQERIELYKKNFEVISELEKKNYVKENFNFLNNYLIPQKNALMNLSVNLIFDFYKEKKIYDEDIFQLTDAPEQKNSKIVTIGTNTFQSFLGLIILELGGEEFISQKYPNMYKIINGENYTKDDLKQLISILNTIMDSIDKFKVEEPNFFSKGFFFIAGLIFDYEIEKIWNFQVLLEKVFIMDPAKRLKAERVVIVLDNLKKRLWHSKSVIESKVVL